MFLTVSNTLIIYLYAFRQEFNVLETGWKPILALFLA